MAELVKPVSYVPISVTLVQMREIYCTFSTYVFNKMAAEPDEPAVQPVSREPRTSWFDEWSGFLNYDFFCVSFLNYDWLPSLVHNRSFNSTVPEFGPFASDLFFV
jgi:hypothetical protein